MKATIDQKVEAAMASGDEYKMALGSYVRDLTNERAERYAEYFSVVPEDKHQELSSLIVKQTIQQAKKNWFDDNGYGDQIKDAIAANDFATVAELNKKNTSGHETYQLQIDELTDDALGIKEVDTKKYKGKTYTDGDYVNYTVGGDIFISDGTESNSHDQAKEQQIKNTADEVARNYQLKNPDKIMEIEWTATKQDDEQYNRRAALDALYTWREKVLPDLPNGLIVASKTAAGGREGNTRERIYTMAGLSPALEDYDDYQFGLVVTDENDIKRVVPIEPGKTQVKENYLLDRLDTVLIDNIDLNYSENVDVIYEGLFQ